MRSLSVSSSLDGARMAERLGPGSGDRQTKLKRLELAVVEHSLNNLMTFPSIRRRVEKGELELHGTYFGVATGVLFLRDPATGEFNPCLETGLTE